MSSSHGFATSTFLSTLEYGHDRRMECLRRRAERRDGCPGGQSRRDTRLTVPDGYFAEGGKARIMMMIMMMIMMACGCGSAVERLSIAPSRSADSCTASIRPAW